MQLMTENHILWPEFICNIGFATAACQTRFRIKDMSYLVRQAIRASVLRDMGFSEESIRSSLDYLDFDYANNV